MRALLGAEPSMGQISAPTSIEIEGTLVYREWTHHAERWLAATLASMARSEPAWSRPPLEAELAAT